MIKAYILFDKTSGSPFHISWLNTDIEGFSYTINDTWALFEQHPSSSTVKQSLANLTMNGAHHYEVDIQDSDFKTKGMFAFQYNPTSQEVEKVPG